MPYSSVNSFLVKYDRDNEFFQMFFWRKNISFNLLKLFQALTLTPIKLVFYARRTHYVLPCKAFYGFSFLANASSASTLNFRKNFWIIVDQLCRRLFSLLCYFFFHSEDRNCPLWSPKIHWNDPCCQHLAILPTKVTIIQPSHLPLTFDMDSTEQPFLCALSSSITETIHNLWPQEKRYHGRLMTFPEKFILFMRLCDRTLFAVFNNAMMIATTQLQRRSYW